MRQSNQNGAPASLVAACCVSLHTIFQCTEYFGAQNISVHRIFQCTDAQMHSVHCNAHKILHLLPWCVSLQPLCAQNIGAHKILLHRKYWCTENIDAQKILVHRKILVHTKYWCTENIGVQKNIGGQKILVHRKYWCTENIGVQKNIGAQKYIGAQ